MTDIFQERARRHALSYEDRILRDEIDRRMAQTIQELGDEGIGVKHDYKKFYGPLNTTRGGKHKPSIGKWQATTDYKPFAGPVYSPTKSTVNVPRTPTLANWLVLNEEASHAREAQRRGNQHKDKLTTWDSDDLAEEYRAKKEAKDMLGGYLTPDVQDFLDYTLESYEAHDAAVKRKKEAAKAPKKRPDTGGK